MTDLLNLSAPAGQIAVVTSLFNSDITLQLEEGAKTRLLQLGMEDKNIKIIRVPGAYEIPLAAKAAIKSGASGVIGLGLVIRGETAHFDYVCSSVERGCTELQLESGVPVAFGVLTTEDRTQAEDRAGGKLGNKGAEAAEAAVHMVNLVNEIGNRT